MTMQESIISIQKLSHRYSAQWAIRDINLEIRKNGIYGLLGSNGAGKSTTMNILCGVLQQTEGNVFIQGIDTKKQPEEAKCRIGFLPQKAPLHLDLTVEEFLSYCAKLHYIPAKEINKAIHEVLERCNISHFRIRLLRNLSGGYQQRVGIAQAIIHHPDFVVLDEPTNGLDPNQILEVRHLIKEIAEERTVLLSTHILSEVQATCEHIYMIEKGHMVFDGSVNEFDNYIRPSTLFVALAKQLSPEDLQAIPGILSVENLGNSQYRLQSANVQEALEQVVESSVSNHWGLIEIYPEKSSLDSIFSELSKK